MINKKTVLVLGAGASQHLGYPIGEKLLSDICQNLSKEDIVQFQQLERLDFKKDEIFSFRESLIKSGVYSVDEFLENRQKFIKLGKTAIAQQLIPGENPDVLFASNKNWYRYLLSGMNTTLDRFSQNQISFITFNYDRSLEQFLFLSLQHKFGLDDDNELRQVAKNIKIVSEDLKESEDFKLAKELLMEAEKIYFLGFGYNETNLNRLKIIEIINSYPDKEIRGTAVNLKSAERRRVIGYFKSYPQLELGDEHEGVDAFLRQHVIFE